MDFGSYAVRTHTHAWLMHTRTHIEAYAREKITELNQWADSVAVVLQACPRAQLSIVAACGFQPLVLCLGAYLAEHLVLQGPLSGLIEPIREFVLHRYLETAGVSSSPLRVWQLRNIARPEGASCLA